MEQIVFLVLSVVAIVSAILVIFSRNPVYSVLFLVVTFFAISGHFALLNAGFLSIVNIIVYAGAIMVLFLFVIMLLNLNNNPIASQPVIYKFAAIISGGLLLITLIGALKGMGAGSQQIANVNIGTVKQLGKVLFDDFLLPFELTSVLFLSAMIGAVMLGKKDLKDH